MKIETKKYPALCETGAEVCDLLQYNTHEDWYNMIVNQCLDITIKPELKAVYREGLEMYHRHIEQLVAYTAKTDQIFKV
jgi:hypothetical protein